MSAVKAELGDAISRVFSSAKVRFGVQLCGFALVTDSDAMSLSCSVNTRENLAAVVAQDPGDARYYRWTPAEWACEGFGIETLEAISNMFISNYATATEIEKHRGEMFELVVSAMEWLIKCGSLPLGSLDLVVVFNVSDGGFSEMEMQWIGRLNDDIASDEFKAWSIERM